MLSLAVSNHSKIRTEIDELHCSTMERNISRIIFKRTGSSIRNEFLVKTLSMMREFMSSTAFGLTQRSNSKYNIHSDLNDIYLIKFFNASSDQRRWSLLTGIN